MLCIGLYNYAPANELTKMRRSKPFLLLMLADFLARSAYQMGKTPLLPIFAAALGASGAFLGLIVTVSTVTGLVLKPLFGILSDRWGRRVWLLIGAGFFASVPFLYRFIHTPEQLLAIRLVHGLATAIYGPCNPRLHRRAIPRRAGRRRHRLVSDGSQRRLYRGSGAGGLAASVAGCGGGLQHHRPDQLRRLPADSKLAGDASERDAQAQTDFSAYQECLTRRGQTPAVWLTGGLEAVTFIALYTLKAFLPIYALEAGVSVALVGLFFSLNELVHVLGKPLCGRLGDRWGYLPAISLGMLILAAALPLARVLDQGLLFLLPAALMGLAQALIFPAAVALVSDRISPEHLGAGMGLIGMLQNFGKVAGPVLGGLAISALGYGGALLSLSAMLAIGTVVIWGVFSPRKLAKLSR